MLSFGLNSAAARAALNPGLGEKPHQPLGEQMVRVAVQVPRCHVVATLAGVSVGEDQSFSGWGRASQCEAPEEPAQETC